MTEKIQEATMSHRARTMPAYVSFYVSFPLTAALLTGALLASFGHALADERTGNYYYDRYALPWVKAYAPPNTAPGTYRSDDGEYPRGSRDHY
jgi:hypothetical protein